MFLAVGLATVARNELIGPLLTRFALKFLYCHNSDNALLTGDVIPFSQPPRPQLSILNSQLSIPPYGIEI